MGLLFAAAPSQLLAGRTQDSWPDATEDANAFLDALKTSLGSSTHGMRIDYTAICDSKQKNRDSYVGPFLFPRTIIRATDGNLSGIAKARQLFRDDGHVVVREDANGILRISIGSVPTSILETKISRIDFSPDEQYDPVMAIGAVLKSSEVDSALRSSGVRIATAFRSYAFEETTEKSPHLQPAMKNVTIEQAMDTIAKTFSGIVLYGYCSHMPVFEIDFTRGAVGPGSQR